MRYITINITLYNSCVMRKENGMGEENLNCQIRRSDKYNNTPKKYGERSVKGKLIGVYPYIFTVKHKFIESFCYADILTREIRVVEAN